MSKTDPTPKIFKTDEFVRLNQEWRQKLKDSKFVDIEEGMEEYYPLVPSIRTDTVKFETMEATKRYYDLCGQYLEEGKFDSERERQVWEHHANGLSLAETGVEMGIHKNTVSYYVGKVHKRIKSLE